MGLNLSSGYSAGTDYQYSPSSNYSFSGLGSGSSGISFNNSVQQNINALDILQGTGTASADYSGWYGGAEPNRASYGANTQSGSLFSDVMQTLGKVFNAQQSQGAQAAPMAQRGGFLPNGYTSAAMGGGVAGAPSATGSAEPVKSVSPLVVLAAGAAVFWMLKK